MADDTKTKEDLQYKPDLVVDGGDLEGGDGFATYAVENNDTSDYYAAGKEYRTYANETDKPVWTDEEKKILGLVKGDDDTADEPKAPVDARVTNDPKLPTSPSAPSATK